MIWHTFGTQEINLLIVMKGANTRKEKPTYKQARTLLEEN
jgi:hypothetical protein